MESSFVAQPNDMSCIRSFSTLISLIQSNPEELTQQFSSQPEVDPASVQRKRRVRQPAEYLTEEDKRERKNARDKRYRERVKVEMNKAKEDLERMKPEYDRVMKIASECGGIDEMETQFRRLQQMVSKYGGFEEIEWKMNKLEQIEAESSIFEKVKTMFGGIDNIVPGLDRLKKTEFQHTVSKPNQNERPSYIDFIPTSPEILQALLSPSISLSF
ncbi:hypothetical protein CCACVL1_10828 [Corchorus capsularis]|uniref:Uncharacterized protein n=1 Tax=Corchorus capsularis TaxID=210143 RepID=A0A1R3IP74_COCAP|nr:hypothetical protein CCACVL1_10828 [Corchorus capsularis]